MALPVLTRGRPLHLATARSRAPDAVRTWTAGQVWTAGLLLVAAQLAFRAWVVFPAWFFLDDYVYLEDARAEGLSWEWLLTPYNGHFMPAARALISLVAAPGPVSWSTAATVSLVLQAAASLACLWCLTRLVGTRPGVLVPLALYLTSVITLPGFVWWAAAINLVGVQATMFVAIAAWVEHLRGGGRRWLALTVLAVLAGMAFDVRGVLVLPTLAILGAAYFARGGPLRRVVGLVRRHAVGLGALVVVGGAYSVYYLATVEQITDRPEPSFVAAVAGTMLGVTLPTALLGGPWQWYVPAPPTGFADPPQVLVVLSWLVMLGSVVWLALRRTRTLRAWLPALVHVLALAFLVASTRGSIGGAVAREYRFLTEAAVVLTIGLALAVFTLPGAVESSAPRTLPSVRRPPRALVATVLLAVVIGSLFSSVRYARLWHEQNASAPYVQQLRAGLAAAGSVDLADQRTPEDVLSTLVFPRNRTSTLAAPLSDLVAFPRESHDLTVVDDAGALRVATIEATTQSPPGPDAACGWRLPAPGTYSVPMAEQVAPEPGWLRIGYLTGAGSEVTITAGGTLVRPTLREGVGSFFMQHAGGFDLVVVEVRGDSDVCIDQVQVGRPVAGGPR